MPYNCETVDCNRRYRGRHIDYKIYEWTHSAVFQISCWNELIGMKALI